MKHQACFYLEHIDISWICLYPPVCCRDVGPLFLFSVDLPRFIGMDPFIFYRRALCLSISPGDVGPAHGVSGTRGGPWVVKKAKVTHTRLCKRRCVCLWDRLDSSRWAVRSHADASLYSKVAPSVSKNIVSVEGCRVYPSSRLGPACSSRGCFRRHQFL